MDPLQASAGAERIVPDDDLVRQLWDQATEEYNNALDPKRRRAQIDTITTLADLERELNLRHGDFESFREKRAKLFRSMQAVLQPVQQLGSIAAGGISGVFAPSTSIFGAVTFLFQAAENVSKKYDAIISMFDDLQELMAHLEVLAQPEIAYQLRTALVKALSSTLKLIALVEKAIRDGRSATYIKRAFAKGDAVLQCRDELERNLRTIHRMVSDATLDLLRRHRRDDHMVKDQQEKARQWNVLEKGLESAFPHRAPEILGGLLRSKLDNTCGWLEEEQAYKHWRSQSCPLLWISGGQGTGKTHLAAAQVSALAGDSEIAFDEDAESNDRPVVAYYFCGKDSSTFDSARRILDTMTYQLLRTVKSTTLFEKACNTYDGKGAMTSALDLWKRLFDSYMAGSPSEQIVLVVDGLDELDTGELDTLMLHLQWLDELSQRTHSTADGSTFAVQMLLLGRPSLSYDVAQRFVCETVEVTSSKSANDISTYIDDSIMAWRGQVPEIFQHKTLFWKVADKLELEAGGSFLWVSLKIKALRRQSRLDRVLEILDEPPEELGALLLNTLESILKQDGDAETLSTVLTFTTWFRRSLTLSELSMIPVVESKTRNKDAVLIGLDDLLITKYSPIYRLQLEDGFTTESLRYLPSSSDLSWIDLAEKELKEDYRDGRLPSRLDVRKGHTSGHSPALSPGRLTANTHKTAVVFEHVSFHEFLSTTDKHSGNTFMPDRNMALLRVAKFCLTLLVSPDDITERAGSALVAHAAQNFTLYLGHIDRNSVPRTGQEEVAELLGQIFNDRKITRKWLRILATSKDRAQCEDNAAISNRNLDSKALSKCCDWLQICPSKDLPRAEEGATQPSLIDRFRGVLRNAYGSQRDIADTVSNTRETQADTIRRSVACAVADEWLEDHGWVDETLSPTGLHALFLCNFVAKAQDPTASKDLFDLDTFPMYPKAIREAAKWYLWSHYEGTATWHTCIALTHLGLKYLHSAIDECNKALALDNCAWHAMYVLSLSHFRLKHYARAREHANECAASWPDDLKWSRLHYRLFRHLSKCHLACDDPAAAHLVMAIVVRTRPSDLHALEELWDFIANEKMSAATIRDLDWTCVGNAIIELHRTRSKSGQDRMCDFLLHDRVYDTRLHYFIQYALRTNQRLESGIVIYQKVIEAAERTQQYQYVSMLHFELAAILFECKGSLEHPIRCIEQRLQLDTMTSYSGAAKSGLSQQQAVYQGICYLTRYLGAKLHRAVKCGEKDIQKTCRRLSELWEIAKDFNPMIPIWLEFQRHCWFHYGLATAQLEDIDARQTFLKRGLWTVINMMARKRSYRDQPGLHFRRLGYLCQIVGDTEGMYASLCLRELAESGEAATRKPGELVEFTGWQCDGPCQGIETSRTTAKELQRCQICLDTDWCQDCMLELQRGRIAYTLCSADHSFLRLTPFEKPADGFVTIGNKSMQVVDWVADLAVSWGMSRDHQLLQRLAASSAIEAELIMHTPLSSSENESSEDEKSRSSDEFVRVA